jgi:hypothetical protein
MKSQRRDVIISQFPIEKTSPTNKTPGGTRDRLLLKSIDPARYARLTKT